MSRSTATDRVCKESWHRAIYAFGTAQIFLRRAHWYRTRLQLVSTAGVIVPLAVGIAAVSFGVSGAHFKYVLILAAVLGGAQALLSAFCLLQKWPDALEYSLESAADSLGLASGFRDLGKTAEDPPDDLHVRYAALQARDDARRTLDTRKGVAPEELRYGHRAGLRHFQRPCDACKEIPKSLDSSDCPVCGRF